MSSSSSNRRRYTNLKMFHFKEKIDSLPEDVAEVLPPVHVRVKPTNRCNHNCLYCAYRSDSLQLGRDMAARDAVPREKMLEIVDDLVEIGVAAVTFSGGGEPLLYPHLLEALRRLIRGGIRVAALTNGSRLAGEVAEALAFGAVWLRVSIDGWDRQSYSEYRGVAEGEFDAVMRNIERFAGLGGTCHLCASIVVDRKNAGHVFELTSMLRDRGARSVKISPCIVSNEGAANNAYHAPVFEEVRAQVDRALSELVGDGFDVHDAFHAQLESFHKEYRWCPYLQILPVIGADLNVYSCQDKAYNLDQGLIGSIRNTRFKDFWCAGKEKFFRIDPSRVCNHHCVADGKNRLVLEYLGVDRDHLCFV